MKIRFFFQTVILIILSVICLSCNKNPYKTDKIRWIALGNSITLHGTTSFWWGRWGMAATKKEKDWVHVFDALLTDYYRRNSSFEAINIADWEGDFNSDISYLRQYFTGQEDIVIFRLGENVSVTEKTQSLYMEELTNLVVFIKSLAPNAIFVMSGNFWPDELKDSVQQSVAEENNLIWVPLGHLYTSVNISSLDTQVFGDDGRWHKISDGGEIASGVAIHPGDAGMYNIAIAIFDAIKNNR